ncbi:MAG: 1-(5-phosphoribosyl)-5-((5-phosphoribosylamino)methylideneamino)imidazole-4-carboxamide isomerase, partial [Campylobacter sp.]|nr:1-(5-phosphoribosyl)-5-((5-phosphoribosylamino)methylideneamino)imidazole-4-carboxamide isomerase [Campylobacter sp.]
MEILPAIDLKVGVAVRLSIGLRDSAKIFSKAPWELAKKFEDFGAKYLHLVDLDGAFAGEAINYKTIEKIVASTNF